MQGFSDRFSELCQRFSSKEADHKMTAHLILNLLEDLKDIMKSFFADEYLNPVAKKKSMEVMSCFFKETLCKMALLEILPSFDH